MKKHLAPSLLGAALIIAFPIVASAHVIVTPNQAGIGQELVFNVSVPNERQTAVSSVKLDIPKGVTEVTPTIVPGFTITTDGSGDSLSAVTWSGTIPVGQREDFSFGAQVPGTAMQLDWKAYQTYTDGTVVHWTKSRPAVTMPPAMQDLTQSPMSSMISTPSRLQAAVQIHPDWR